MDKFSAKTLGLHTLAWPSLFTLTTSQKHPLYVLLHLLMILISICQIPLLMFFRQLLLELCKSDHWLRANELSLNYNKTNFNLLTSRKHKVIIKKHNISPEDNLKYLGVLLDNKLSWKPHVQKVKTQLSRACGILSKLKHCTTPPVLKVVYDSLIHQSLNYSILIWGRASNATIQPLTSC